MTLTGRNESAAIAARQDPPPRTPSSQRRLARIGGALGLGLLSGALATVAYPPFELWPLIFVAFVPMIVGMYRLAPPRWAKAVFGVAFAAFLAGQFSAGLAEGDVAPIFQLMPLIFGGLFAVVVWRSRRFHERTDFRWLPLTFPLAWVALDFLRANGSGAFSALGGTWANPVYPLFRQTSFIQPVSIFGIFGLELLILVVNFTVGLVVLRLLERGRLPRVAPAVVATAMLVWALLGAFLMDSPASGDRTVRVAAIQTGTDGPVTPAEEARRLPRDIAQTRAAAARGAKLVVWNEWGLAFNPQAEHTDELRALARETGAHIAMGYGFTDDRGRKHNEVVVLSPNGTFSQPYGKDHPGTFAGDYSDTQGTYPVKRTEFGVIGTVICYDLDFTDTARKMTRNGARLLAASSNDVKAIADTHYTHLVFRSIENRVPTVKADTGYDSAVIDQWGRILTSTTNPSGKGQRTLIADVTLGSGRSAFVTFGDWFGWLAVCGMILATALSRLSVRRRRRAVQA